MPENIMVNGFNINGNPIPYNYDSLGNKLEKTSIAREYSNVDTYDVDEYVIYNGKMYKCKQKILVGESFDSTKWDECSVGPELNYIKKFMTLSDEAKQALLNCFSHVAWVDEHGQDYYDVLEAALYHSVDLLSISAVFEQGETVIYDTDSLDVLKPMLTVTENYDNGTSKTVTGYALSGTLTEGTSTITVSYGGKTATFDVTVTKNREIIFGQFSNGIAVTKSDEVADSPYYNSQCCARRLTAARACAPLPITNNNYVFTVTDSSKYNLAAFDVQDITQLPIRASVASAYYDAYAYLAGSKSIAWVASDRASAPYVWIALKKKDGTAFTDEELANGAEAVFTYTEGN